MAIKRTDRLNSLLKEVISEVIRKDVKNPYVNELVTITRVDITKDLHHAKVFFSVIGNDEQKKETLGALNSAAGFIATRSSKKVVMHFFPNLVFKLDDSVEKHMRIQDALKKIDEEKKSREPHLEDSDNEDLDDDE